MRDREIRTTRQVDDLVTRQASGQSIQADSQGQSQGQGQQTQGQGQAQGQTHGQKK
jgi:hypothetical protein